jgi:hypothetical protein
MTDTSPSPSISLLWPSGDYRPSDYRTCDACTVADLGIESLIDALSINRRYREHVRQVLLTFCDDPEVIRYRQETLDDLLQHPELVEAFDEILPRLLEIAHLRTAHRKAETPLHETLWRLGELEIYGECVQTLYQALEAAGDGLRARGLRALRDALRAITEDASFCSLMRELPKMRSAVSGLRSVTIGINLDHLFRPVGATLLSINDEHFQERSMLEKLLGRRDANQGIGPLHSASEGIETSVSKGALYDAEGRPLMQPLFRDLDRIVREVVEPIARWLGGYVHISSQFLLQLEWEIVFFLGGARLIRRLREEGLPVCRPELAPLDERVCEIDDLYNVNLALHMAEGGVAEDLPAEMVLNDAHFGDELGRIFLLTGPNRGGKTTYTQAVGLGHVLCQSGLYVPGSRAKISPVDNVYTHFPAAEEACVEKGRLGEEASRLSDIFQRATRHSLVLLNESLFSTSPGESLYLARDVVRALRYLGARAVYATHLHALAADLDALNQEVAGDSTVASLVARVMSDGDEPEEAMVRPGDEGDGSEAVQPTYEIVPGPPLGMSYARQIAARYGISYDKLIETIARQE